MIGLTTDVNLESWQAIAGASSLFVVAVWNRWDAWRIKRAAQGGRRAADRAVELSTPTGNGFAKKVTEALARIEANQRATDEKLDKHIMAHANADVANRPRRVLRDVNEL